MRSLPHADDCPLRDEEAGKQELVIEVELNRIVLDDDPTDIYVAWHAEWGIRDGSMGIEESSEDVAELVACVLSDLRPMTDDYAMKLEWIVGGNPPSGKTVREEIADLSVRLPDVVL
jgi:hypothetical protein